MTDKQKPFNHDSYSNKRELRRIYSFNPSDSGQREGGGGVRGTEDRKSAASSENDAPTNGGNNETQAGINIEWICSLAENRIKETTNLIREEIEKMSLTKPQDRGVEQSSGKSRSYLRNDQTGLPNLRVSDVGRDKMQAKIIDAREPREDDKYGNAVILKVEYNRGVYLWNLKANNPCYGLFFKAIKNPDEPKNWAGVEFTIYKEPDEFTEVQYIRIEVAKQKRG